MVKAIPFENISSSSTVISSIDTTTKLTSTTKISSTTKVSTSAASSTSELATTTTTTIETTSSASTTIESTTMTATACPTPITCNNLGFDWAYYSNPTQNTNTTYSNFHPDSFKKNTPGPIYGSAINLNLDYFALNHHGYIYAYETGTYQFNIPYANDAIYLWLSAKAYIS
ncbi:PA14 domain-containing protein [Fusarium keratoplasticum]|uniref:PA14 domain-containing protein n=1 Tax=Fusarium keratoplasticum TaxID=1328300 RepID=A0ACC0QLC1_9HYPO|nr:PA14 domain-containing protein [Fusarium keratoplasticum]KAI8660059.1 PA14 domain-containing protein [Fusarium keratoplasticum]